MESRFYSVGEMSVILGMTERSIYRLGRKIPGYCKIGGRVYFNRATFDKATLGTQEPAKTEAVPVYDRHSLV